MRHASERPSPVRGQQTHSSGRSRLATLELGELFPERRFAILKRLYLTEDETLETARAGSEDAGDESEPRDDEDGR